MVKRIDTGKSIFDKVKKRTSIGNSSRSKPKNKHKLKSWKKYNRQGQMWSIVTIICFINLGITPFCSIGGKLPISFDNFESCDKAIDSIVLKVDNQMKLRKTTLIMKCLNNEQVNT